MDETTKYRGYTIRIVQDENPLNPREDMDNLGIMVFFHKRHVLGDSGTHGFRSSDFSSWYELEQCISKKHKGVLITPVYMYDHSGLTISVNGDTYPYNDRWDAGQIGFIFTTPQRIREWYQKKAISSVTLEKARKMLLSEVETYDQYLRGDVWGLIVEGKDGEQIDLCFGIYGTDYAMSEAKASIDCIKDGQKEIKQKNAKKQLRDSQGRFVKQA